MVKPIKKDEGAGQERQLELQPQRQKTTEKVYSRELGLLQKWPKRQDGLQGKNGQEEATLMSRSRSLLKFSVVG